MKSTLPDKLTLDTRDRQLRERIASMSSFRRRCVWRRHCRTSDLKHGAFLYKFRSIENGDEKSISKVRSILVESKLFLSAPDTFNDPFDMSARMTFEGTPQEKRRRVEKMVRRQEPQLTKRQRNQLISDFLARPDIASTRLLQLAQDVNRDVTGVFCFAGDPRNILMWSHYANNHKGICIQFDRSQDIELAFGAFPVNYSDAKKFPTLNWASDSASENVKACLKKSADWSYECECRLVKPLSANTVMGIDPQAVVGVILGCQMDLTTRATVFALLEERRKCGLPDCTIWQAHKMPDRVGLRIARV